MTEHATRSRRDFLTLAGLAAVQGRSPAQAADPATGWSEVPKILARIKAPVFPNRDFNITRYGAKPDGRTDASAAITQAIAECNRAGGGRVVVPPGKFLTAAIHLKSNVNLHVSEGASLLFDRDPKRYLPLVRVRWESVECMNYSPFIYAIDQENIAVTGLGTLDGQADCDHWWPWKGRTNCGWKEGQPNQLNSRAALFEMGAKDVPVSQRVLGEGHYLRPQFIQPFRCKNLLFEGITIVNSPMWEITPVFCTNVIVRDVKIDSKGPNNDGCDPDSCKDVLIEKCRFATGDDCIAIKAGRNRDGRRAAVASENFIIRDCVMADGHGGVTIGSEMSGGVRNIFTENCRLDSPNLNQGLRFKTNAVRGGTIENIYFRNITIGQISDAILQVDFFYEEGIKGTEKPMVRNIDIRDVTCKKGKYALYLRGFPQAKMSDIHLENCTFDGIAEPDVVENVERLTFTNVKINGKVVRGV